MFILKIVALIIVLALCIWLSAICCVYAFGGSFYKKVTKTKD